jgi:flagellar hook protein FlgE
MSGRAGAIVSGALEASNVESAEELTKLIVAQHGFQLSTRAMSVSNAIIQELAHII